MGLIGLAQAGKDTFARYLGYHRVAFADPLKKVALQCNPRFGVIDPEAKEKWGITVMTHTPLSFIVDHRGWEFAKTVPGVREFLQNLGVGIREFGPDYWVDAAFHNYDPTVPTVFTDVRFPNELDAVRDRGGVIVKIVRIGLAPVNGHISEQLAETGKFDYLVQAADGDFGTLNFEAEHLHAILSSR